MTEEKNEGPFGDKKCKHGVPIGADCQKCLDYIRAIGLGKKPDEDAE